MLPELLGVVQRLIERWNAPPLTLKSAGLTFDATNVDWYARNGYQRLYSLLGGGGQAWSGEPVSLHTALNHSVVWACVKIISETVGFLPLVMMRKVNGEKREAEGKPLVRLLKNAPNAEMDAVTFRETLTSHAVLQGNAYAEVRRRSGSGEAVELNLLEPAQVNIERERGGERRVTYTVSESGMSDRNFTIQRGKPQDILHIKGLGPNGLEGYSVIQMARQSIGTALAGEHHVGQFYKMGGRVPHVLKGVPHFSDTDFAKFRADWETMYSVPHRTPMLEGTMEYQQIGLNARDAQLLESRQFSIPEICRWFSISPHLVGDLSRATFSNIEQLALEFVKLTLHVWLVRWEQALWRCALTPEEQQQDYYFKHNVNALLRGDFKTRMEGYASALQNGHLNVDEVRELEDRNKLPDGAGEDYHIQLNMQALPSEDPVARTAPSLVKLGKGQP